MKVLLALLVVLLASLQYRLWFGSGSAQEVAQLRIQAEEKRNEVVRLTERNQALTAEVADLKSGLDAIEERARSELGMIDEDETFFQFIGEKEKDQTALAAPPPPANSLSIDENTSTETSTEGVQP